MILTFTPNPCVDKTVFVDELALGSKIRSQRCTCIPGGKGINVARAAKALGCDAASLTILGGRPGQHVQDMIVEQDKGKCIPVWVDSPTRTITTVLEEPCHRQTAIFEPGSAITPLDKERLLETFREHVSQALVVTFNGAVSDPVLDDIYTQMIPIAHEAGAATVLDSYGAAFLRAVEAKPFMIKPNLEEAESILQRSLQTPAEQWAAMDEFHQRGIHWVVLSLGEDGARVSGDGFQAHLRPPKIDEVNPVGSGDSLVAAFAVGLHEKWPIQKSAQWGIAAGTANALSWDIGHFTLDEVERLTQQIQEIPRTEECV